MISVVLPVIPIFNVGGEKSHFKVSLVSLLNNYQGEKVTLTMNVLNISVE